MGDQPPLLWSMIREFWRKARASKLADSELRCSCCTPRCTHQDFAEPHRHQASPETRRALGELTAAAHRRLTRLGDPGDGRR